MKNFQNYTAEKYINPDFQEVEQGIYKTKSPYGNFREDQEDIFVTSLSFEMEPEQYGEKDASPRNITQIPIEGLLDEFNLFVTDFYEKLNETSKIICYQEFGSFSLEDIQRLRTMMGKRFYAVPYIDKDDGEEYYDMFNRIAIFSPIRVILGAIVIPNLSLRFDRVNGSALLALEPET